MIPHVLRLKILVILGVLFLSHFIGGVMMKCNGLHIFYESGSTSSDFTRRFVCNRLELKILGSYGKKVWSSDRG